MKRKRFVPEIETTEMPDVVQKVILKRAEPLFWECLNHMRYGFINVREILCSMYMQGFVDGHAAGTRKNLDLENTGGDGI